MQDYKIRIPSIDIRDQILDKAYELGYTWYDNSPPASILGLGNKIYLTNGDITYGESDLVFSYYSAIEISYQDFLRLGEIDVNNCKIKLRYLSEHQIILLGSKLESLGIKPYGAGITIVRSLWYTTLSAEIPFAMFIRNGTSSMVGTEQYFNQLPERELTVAQIMQLQPTINNTTTEQIMSGEVTLKCITAPQRAKNITVDRDYTGILIDSDDSQVDTLREATHFRCVNNNGIEAKYKLALFAQPEPPRLQFPSWEQIELGIQVNDDKEVVLYFNDEKHIIYDNEDELHINEDMRCCGLDEIDGIQSLHRSIEVSCRFDLLEDNTNQQRLKDLVFKALVNYAIEENRGAFRIFTLVSGHDAIDALMKEIMTERGGVETEYRISTSSSNAIKVFVINL
jgi:hypothetical protein